METVLYIAELVIPEIQERYNFDSYSQAGYHKVTNIINSLMANDKKVVVISPLLPTGSPFIHRHPKRYSHPENDTDIITPRSFNIYNIMIINRLLLVLFTTIEVIKQILKEEINLVLYYNTMPSRAIPATIGSVFGNIPLVLEYEDGYFADSSTSWGLAIEIARAASSPWLDGAVCVNTPLAERAPTKNTVIFRGFPSVGLSKNLPNIECKNSNSIIMYAGKFDRLRGVDTYIDAIDRSCNEKCEFWVSGWGKEEEINRVEKKLELVDDSRIKFFGQLPFHEYRNRCIRADILINPQDPEHPRSKYTFPSKILDFLSSSSIVITTDMSDLKLKMSEILIIGGKDAESLSKTLNTTLEMSQTNISKKKEDGQKWINEHCDYERVGREIIALGSA